MQDGMAFLAVFKGITLDCNTVLKAVPVIVSFFISMINPQYAFRKGKRMNEQNVKKQRKRPKRLPLAGNAVN
ncbi:MAG: hypothetical protein IKH57_16100 [Clostridia bacterium]|nr:hypothetical protein [Clostridia bacterium]